MPVMSYADVRHTIGDARSHLLLGNGFSIGCDPVFRYASLYDRAVQKGLSPRAQEIFQGLGTNNFEGVMHLLEKAHWVAHIYGLIEGNGSAMLGDLEIVKTALVEAIAESHLPNTGSIPDARKAAALKFLAPHHNVFTTNYDLLLYWVVMSEEGGPSYRDGFGDDPEEPAAPYVVFSFRIGDRKGIYYLHGGLHLHLHEGLVAKHCWSRSHIPLTTLITQGMADSNYPLFVAEGTAEKKLQQIHRSSYLSYAFEKLGRIQKNLVVFGHTLGESDDHLRHAIAGNRMLECLYIGVHGDGSVVSADQASRAIGLIRLHRNLPQLTIRYFDSHTAAVWEQAASPADEQLQARR